MDIADTSRHLGESLGLEYCPIYVREDRGNGGPGVRGGGGRGAFDEKWAGGRWAGGGGKKS